MTDRRLSVFLDCNVLIEGFWFPLLPAGAVCTLGANKHIDLVTCALVIYGTEKHILAKASEKDDYDLIDTWTTFLRRIRLYTAPNPPIKLVAETKDKYLGVMKHIADIPVLASAIELKPDIILSDNTKHFNKPVSERCGIAIWSCEQFLTYLIAGTVREKLNK